MCLYRTKDLIQLKCKFRPHLWVVSDLIQTRLLDIQPSSTGHIRVCVFFSTGNYSVIKELH